MTQKTETELHAALEGSMDDDSIPIIVDRIKEIIDRNSSIRQVEEFMVTFNQKVRTQPEMPTPKECLFRLELCKEELVEAAEACGSEVLSHFGRNLYETSEKIRQKVENQREHLKPNLVALLDALKDMPYVAYGFEVTAGLQNISEEAFLEVHNSNMSKACNSLEEAKSTVEDYQKQSINVVSQVKGSGCVLILRASDDKVLKSINYKPANLKKFIENGI